VETRKEVTDVADVYVRRRGEVPEELERKLRRLAKKERPAEVKVAVCRECGLPYNEAYGRGGLCLDCAYGEEEE